MPQHPNQTLWKSVQPFRSYAQGDNVISLILHLHTEIHANPFSRSQVTEGQTDKAKSSLDRDAANTPRKRALCGII
jgi:hypothetical protein